MSLNGQRAGHPQGMIVTLDTARLRTIEQVEAFLQGTAEVGFSPPPESERYISIGRTLTQFAYQGCGRRQRGLLRRFIQRLTGYSRAQVNRLIAQHRDSHRHRDQRGPPAVPFAKRPDPQGRAGFLRIDSVYQGDHEGMKAIYYINVVDCMTRFQAVFAVAAISEAFLLPILSP